MNEYFQSTNGRQNCWAGSRKGFLVSEVGLNCLKFSQVQTCNCANSHIPPWRYLGSTGDSVCEFGNCTSAYEQIQRNTKKVQKRFWSRDETQTPAFQVTAINRKLQSCTLSCTHFLAQGTLHFFQPKGMAAADRFSSLLEASVLKRKKSSA